MGKRRRQEAWSKREGGREVGKRGYCVAVTPTGDRMWHPTASYLKMTTLEPGLTMNPRSSLAFMKKPLEGWVGQSL